MNKEQFNLKRCVTTRKEQKAFDPKRIYALRGFLMRCEYSTEDLIFNGFTLEEILYARRLNERMEVSV